MQNCAYLWKNHNYAPADPFVTLASSETYLSSLPAYLAAKCTRNLKHVIQTEEDSGSHGQLFSRPSRFSQRSRRLELMGALVPPISFMIDWVYRCIAWQAVPIGV